MTANRPLFAAMLALMASAILSLADNFVGAVKETAGLWQFQLVKAMIALSFLYSAAVFVGLSCRPQNWGWLILRSVLIAVGLLTYFAALGVLPVAQAGAGLYSAPIWIMLFSVLFLGKRIGKRRVVAMIAGFVGVLMLLQPDLSNLTVFSALPLVAGAFYGTGGLATKQLCGDENPVVLALGVFATIAAISIVMLGYLALLPSALPDPGFHARGWEPLSQRFLWLTFTQAIGAAFSIAVLANAYRFAEPDFVAVCEYSFLIFAAVWALALWGLPTNLAAQGGIAIIILSGAALFLLDRPAKPAFSLSS
ncbi:DMT family transporter [Phaeobacter gallaeciensis]|uniref:Permease n=1 Tax=Phaeobacter gallaeciensis TaxID=60890 RepID=A0AAC9Z7Z7_9RHOB|nr:DMT family transporter [Phaeobacter gallaeciensis]AHD08867.1 putative permease [Phaeobacter gallaeciensis DSM 26640]ATE92133.1 putative permease [Phaeobacter gallaeciensis]ATE98048.1 putative permease [Phaeobacter gallaeciensis]ATF00744.1 putative permease [Phaeobacter gallaeciensis]ATF05175.1 putative permease [Phaeobacter gallaeciensis]